MNTNQYDVIVVGGGPSGSSAAYMLAAQKLRVLVIDKEVFPRDKVCAAGIPVRTPQIIPFDVTPVLEATVYKATFVKNLKDSVSFTHSEPVMYCSNRTDFDNFLLQKAVEQGVELLQGVRVTAVHDDREQPSVETEKGTFTARYIIGADGANSVVGRKILDRSCLFKSVGLEAEIYTSPEAFDKYKETIVLEFGSLPFAYAWLFPKSDHLSIGVGCSAATSRFLKPYLANFIQSLQLGETDQRYLKSFPLYSLKKFCPLTGQSIILAGDAAGLINPLTGEGIFHAVQSGQFAAQTLIKLFHKTEGAHITDYNNLVKTNIFDEFVEYWKVINVFNVFLGYIFSRMKVEKRYWRGVIKLLNGELTTHSFSRLLNRVRFLWDPISIACGFILDMKIKNFNRKRQKQ